MYPIPANPDLTGIIDSPLTQVCFGEFILQFHFESNARLECQGTIQHSDQGTQLATWADGKLSGPAFLSLLGKRPTRFQVISSEKLELYFENGQILTLLNDSEQYESFQIYQSGNSHPSLII